MTDTTDERALAAILAAGEVIAQMNRRFEEQDNRLRAAGIDPEKFRADAAAQASDKTRAAVDEMLKPHLEAAERAAQEFTGDKTSITRASKPRTMV